MPECKDLLSFKVDHKRLIKEQIIIMLSFIGVALALIAAVIAGYRISMLFLVLLSPVCIILTFLLIATPWCLISIRNPLKFIEFDPSTGIVRINDDRYDFVRDNLYFEFEDGIQKLILVCGINLKVINDDKKIIRQYYAGPVLSKYASDLRKQIKLALLSQTEIGKQKNSFENISEEYENSFGVIKIEFPADSIRNEFYKTGILILVPLLAGCIISILPPSVFENDQLLLKMVSFLRFLIFPTTIMWLVFFGSYYFTYRKLARTVEIRDSFIKINDQVFYKNGIRRISAMNPAIRNGYDGEAGSWLIIYYESKMYRFYLGQAKNGKCLEPRRKLMNALMVAFNAGEPGRNEENKDNEE